ncbi:MAG: phenylacetate-CoA oxygenase subunit PaaJ [Anaerolineales bacterium]|nr:phenylacetate-CoA oxygenase subunit PaaJ [Anaerolineales bacterium]MCB9126705.1 phenylacetate-CoA oxygenase subunit PaaJ [Ardenticatenales bacterium]MCB9171753.1 phenylacetate-CoA oxygenase subunit PaaJ [Ardenticatenales bacterium]
MIATQPITEAAVWSALDAVTDPEIPVVSVVELGIIQGVTVDAQGVTVAMTPTFAGCPALYLMQEEIAQAVVDLGLSPEQVQVQLQLDPPWSSERITESGRVKLASIGLAPPERVPSAGGLIAVDEIMLADGVECPFCHSHATELESPFGPTMCRSLYYCHGCKQPFEKFKAL